MRRASLLLVLSACQVGGGGDGGLVVVSDTAQMGPPPACNAETPTTGESTGTDDTADGTGTADDTADGTGTADGTDTVDGTADGTDDASHLAGLGGLAELSSRTGATRAADPGTDYCAGFTSHAACDGTPRMDGDRLIGECRWITVVPVVPGTCEATQLYETCVHVPRSGADCEAAGSCGQVGLGVYGRTGCDGTVEIIVVPPGSAFCAAPTDWPLCWPDDTAPECSCVCT